MENIVESLTEETEPKLHRIQFDVEPTTLKDIDDLKRLAGVTSRADFFRNAFKLYEKYLRRRAAKYELYFKRGDDIEKVDFL